MRVAFVVYDGMTLLDFIGFYDPVTRIRSMGFLDDFSWDVCARTESVGDRNGLRLIPTRVGEPLNGYDLIFVPGGFATRPLSQNEEFMDWLRTAADARTKTAVCTGSILLGAAGFLQGRSATGHPSSLHDLGRFCRVSTDRIVDAGDVITAGGVSASIDLGLYVVEKIAGSDIRRKIQKQMDYPYHSGS